MKLPGPNLRGSRRDTNKETLNMIAIMQGKTAPYQAKKTRGKDKHKRDLAEAKFRKEEVLPYLRKMRSQKKVLFYRIENGLPGYKGISDFLIFSFITNTFFFCELKSPTGEQSENQKQFENACIKCSIKYLLTSNIDDIKKIVEKTLDNVRV